MKLPVILAAVAIAAAAVTPARAGETTRLFERFAAYEQGKPLAVLIETRQAVFAGTDDESVRAGRERGLLAFIASDAHPQAKAIAIEWLGSLGSAASVPGLVAARGNPALAAPVAAALASIPGPEAEQARLDPPANALPVAPPSAEVGRFHAALARENSDDLIAAAIISPNDLLVGAALRRIRAGDGSPALAGNLLAGLDKLPALRQATLLDALAARGDAGESLHSALVTRTRSGDPAALATLGRMLRPGDLPMVLELAAARGNPGLAAAAATALARATDPGITPALIRHATAGGPLAAAAIDALTARRASDATDALWKLTDSAEPALASAAFESLGLLLPPPELADVIDKLAAADGGPAAAELGKLLWNVARRHPDPAAAADLLEQRAAGTPAGVRELLVRYATRLRPKDAPPQSRIEPPADDDSAILAPDHHPRLAYLNAGSFTEASAGALRIRRTAGESHQFRAPAHPLATTDFGREITYEITGLDAGADYVLGFSAWDADGRGRRQSLEVNGTELLPDFAPIGYHGGKPTHIRVHLPLARKLTRSGSATVTVKSLAGPNAVISELWLLRRAADAPREVKRVVILTGDDYPAHHWRFTGPEFARILRADPRLEVTVTESPALLGSPALASYDAVFLHFKNYQERLPTSPKIWQNLESYVHAGGGLVIAHFGCGAMQEWNGYVNIAGRIWNPEKRGHDPYGEFIVRILQTGHPATRGVADFTTTDELYTCLDGGPAIQVLAEATSKVDQKDYPMAFVLTPGKGRVFHSPLGHNTQALKAEGARKLYLQGTRWAAGVTNDE